jgi:outer membrane protein assembly factor BamB
LKISLEQSSPSVVNNTVYIGGWYNVPLFTQKGSVYAVNAQTGNLVWETLQNVAFSTSPFVQNNKLFIGGDGGVVYSLDASNGSVFWQKTILHNSASPIEVNGIVYVGGGGTGFFYALDAGNGNEIWKFAIPGGLTTSSPLIINGSGDPKHCGDSGALP